MALPHEGSSFTIAQNPWQEAFELLLDFKTLTVYADGGMPSLLLSPLLQRPETKP